MIGARTAHNWMHKCPLGPQLPAHCRSSQLCLGTVTAQLQGPHCQLHPRGRKTAPGTVRVEGHPGQQPRLHGDAWPLPFSRSSPCRTSVAANRAKHASKGTRGSTASSSPSATTTSEPLPGPDTCSRGVACRGAHAGQLSVITHLDLCLKSFVTSGCPALPSPRSHPPGGPPPPSLPHPRPTPPPYGPALPFPGPAHLGARGRACRLCACRRGRIRWVRPSRVRALGGGTDVRLRRTMQVGFAMCHVSMGTEHLRPLLDPLPLRLQLLAHAPHHMVVNVS